VRIAVLSDIHGNLPALEGVVKRTGVCGHTHHQFAAFEERATR
jgi:hypothetical protein